MSFVSKSMLAATAAATMTLLSACGPANVQLRPSNTCDSSPDGLKLCNDQCNANEARACYRIGWFHEVGQEVSQSMKRAIDHYKKSCDLDFAVACRALGQIYWEGEEVKRNPQVAIQFFRKACRLGIPEACPSLAMVAQSEGRRIKPGEDRAFETAAGHAPNAPQGPDTPDAPEIQGPTAPTLEAPKTPAIEVQTPTF